MARIRRSEDLGSREGRRRLKISAEPYWHRIEPGLFLGYRKSKDSGTWLTRRYLGPGKVGTARYLEKGLAQADDFRDADGREVLTFSQAQRKLLEDAHENAVAASGQRYTVANAVGEYVDYLRQHRKSADDSEQKLKAYVLPRFHDKQLSDLTGTDLETWLTWAMSRRRRTRAKAQGAEVGHVPAKDQPAERQRRRRSTLNRVISAFHACLEHAARRGKRCSREAWAGLKKFRSADSARQRWLTVEEAKRLQNAAPQDLRRLISAALNTGCRAGELLALTAGDFDPVSQTVLVADSKSGKPRRVPLTGDGVRLFEQLTAGKLETDPLFPRLDGASWYRMALVRAMRAACVKGKVSADTTFHTLRHTYASHLAQAGVPLLFVAHALGHRDTRMVEKHYGHLAPSHIADAIRAALPSFGEEAKGTVRTLRGRAKRTNA